jgi:hypothetical protein
MNNKLTILEKIKLNHETYFFIQKFQAPISKSENKKIKQNKYNIKVFKN